MSAYPLKGSPLLKYILLPICLVISSLVSSLSPPCLQCAEYRHESSAAGDGGFAQQKDGDSDIEVQVKGQRIENIMLVGNSNTDREVILMAFGLEDGEIITEEKLEKGKEKIERLASVSAVQIRLMKGTAASNVRIFIIISEDRTRSLTPYLSRRLTNDWSFGAKYIENNYKGDGQRLYAAMLFGGATIIEGSWTKPFSVYIPYIGASCHARYADYKYVYPDYQELLLDDNITQIETGASFLFNALDFLLYYITPGIDWVDVADSMLVGQGTHHIPPAPRGTFTTFEFGMVLNTLDREWYPTRGIKFVAARKDWGLFLSDSDKKHFKYWGELLTFFKWGKTINSFLLRGVDNRGGTPIWLIEHLGGEGTIRGLEYGVLSGDNSLFTSIEVRYPLNFRDMSDLGNPIVLVDFHAFVDSGACWRDHSEDELSFDNFYTGFGCGLNIIPWRNGLLKIDYAWSRETNGMWRINAGLKF